MYQDLARAICPRIPLLILPMLLSSCVFVPTTTEFFDADCQISAKQMELTPVQIAALRHCEHRDCAAFLAAAGATASVSALISGSIVVVGNVVYWFEKIGRCKRKQQDEDQLL